MKTQRYIRGISNKIGRFIPEKSILKVDAPPFLPFYHVVSNQQLLHIPEYAYRSESQFEKELDFYLKYFKPVSLEYLYKNHDKKEKIFHLSFDDGLKECEEIIAPILLKKGIPATFFVNTNLIDNKALFHKFKASLILQELKRYSNFELEAMLKDKYLNSLQQISTVTFEQKNELDEIAEAIALNFSDFLLQQKPYLTTKQLLSLKNNGFSIGAHSLDHPEFWRISTDKQIEQICKSIDWINTNIQPAIKAFAFPFTDDGVSAKVLKKIRDENICDITFGTAGLKYDVASYHLQRYPVEKTANFIDNIKGEWVYFLIRKWLRKATVMH